MSPRKIAPADKVAYADRYRDIDFRQHPEKYRIGIGEQGVLIAQPYKNELLPLWRFRTPAIAQQSADALYAKYCEYRQQGDFVGMDMARKYIQMGFTRSRRYANHKGGRKYAEDGVTVLPRIEDPVKAESAQIFKLVWERVMDDPAYQAARAAHEERYQK